MGKRRRGRDRPVSCSHCGRSVPREKAVEYQKRMVFSTDMKTADDVTYSDFVTVYYCISCAKHRGIFEKKKERLRRRREREMYE